MAKEGVTGREGAMVAGMSRAILQQAGIVGLTGVEYYGIVDRGE